MYIQQIPNNDIKQIVKAGTYLASTSVSNRPESLGWWYITAIKVQGNVLALTARDINYVKVYSGILDHDDNDTLEWSRCDNFGYNSLSDLANALGGLPLMPTCKSKNDVNFITSSAGLYVFNGSGNLVNGPQDLPNSNFFTIIYDTDWNTYKRVSLLFCFVGERNLFYIGIVNENNEINWLKYI